MELGALELPAADTAALAAGVAVRRPTPGGGGGAIWIETSNRSQPFACDAITVGNLDDVRVSVGGVALAGENRSFTSTAFEPAFEGDIQPAPSGRCRRK